MMWITEIGQGGLYSDRLFELINYCVVGDGSREKKLCIRDVRIVPLMGAIMGH